MRWKGEKEKAWQRFRKIIRSEETDCYTCPKKDLIENGIKADCGHYKPVALVGSNNLYSWRREFVHLQCSRCNGPGQGMALEYRKHLVTDYGEAFVKEFDDNYRQVRPVKIWTTLFCEIN